MPPVDASSEGRPATLVGDNDCVRFLQWALPKLRLRWPGYRKVRKTVCKRLRRRLRTLGLEGLDAYRDYLSENPCEWAELDSFCRIPISRFYRHRGVFDLITQDVLPRLAADAVARGETVLKCWSAGCASGEEAYSLRLVWDLRLKPDYEGLGLEILGTDIEPVMLRRAETACYPRGALKDLPPDLLRQGFDLRDEEFCVKFLFRHDIRFQIADIREVQSDDDFDLILCRNLVFTYFTKDLQAEILAALIDRLRPGGVLVTGAQETLPQGAWGLAQLEPHQPLYRKTSDAK